MNALQTADYDAFALFKSFEHHTLAILQFAQLHAAIFDFVLIRYHVNELLSLIGAQCLFRNG